MELIRSLDFLESLPYVRRDAIGGTGESGGGTQTFLLGGRGRSVKVAAPVNMISLHMQGGCLCENPPGLRLDTNNVEIAATIAPRPLLMVSATGDWTARDARAEFPAVRSLYALRRRRTVHAVRVDAPSTTTTASTRGDVRLDGALAAERASRTRSGRNARSRPTA